MRTSIALITRIGASFGSLLSEATSRLRHTPGNPIIPIKINATNVGAAFFAPKTNHRVRILILPLPQNFLSLGKVSLDQSHAIGIDYGNNIVDVLGQKVTKLLIFLYKSSMKEPDCGE